MAGVPLPWLMFCTIMSTLMVASPSALKMRAATPGLSGTRDERDFGLVFVERDAANDDAFHAFGFFFHNGSWVVVQAGADFKDDSEFFGKLNRARLHHLGAEAGEFEHFIVGNFLELLRARHNARVGRVNAVHVRINLAQVRFQRRGQRNGGQIGTAAAQRGDLAFRRLALETGDDDDVALVQQVMDVLGRDVLNFRLGVNAVGDDARLRAGQRNGRECRCECSAMAVSAMVVCSPVASSTSISRSLGSGMISLASLIRLSVTPLIAETTTTILSPLA